MFTLRKITGDGVELNFYLGKSYTLVLADRNPEEFNRGCKKFHYDVEGDKVFGFIYGEVQDKDQTAIGLFSTQQNYVMTGSGKTYDRLTT